MPVDMNIAMRIEASDIIARSIEQGAAPLGMPPGGCRLTDEAEGGHAGERPAGGHQELPP